MKKSLLGNRCITYLTLISLSMTLILALIINFNSVPLVAYLYFIFWISAAILFVIMSYKIFIPGYLLGLFCTIIAWRILGIYNVYNLSIILSFTFLLNLSNFIYCIHHNIKDQNTQQSISIAAWQLIFIRIYIGFNFIPHFTEKLFSGISIRHEDVVAFMHLGVQHADFFVWLAGLCEFGAAIAIGLGLMLRIGSYGAVLYLFIATYLGHHFSLGFIWAGGGWEFSTLWMILILSFAITGFKEFTLDQYLQDKFNIPSIIKKLM